LYQQYFGLQKSSGCTLLVVVHCHYAVVGVGVAADGGAGIVSSAVHKLTSFLGVVSLLLLVHLNRLFDFSAVAVVDYLNIEN